MAVPGAQPGATTPLYNGLVGDGVHTGVVADAIAGALNSDRQYGQDQEEQISMAFVNEYVSEEDIKKYNLEEIWLEYNVIYRKTGVPSHVRLNWTVDHDRCIYLMWIGGAGYDQDFTDWVLYLNGKSINFRLTKPGEGSKSFKEQPYRIVWDLMSIHPELPEPAKRCRRTAASVCRPSRCPPGSR